MTKKYELTTETTALYGRTLYRIKALKSFSDVKFGDLGGYIEIEENLSQNDNCWIYDSAKVCDYARTIRDAKIKGNAVISAFAIVAGSVIVSGNAKIKGNAVISDFAIVSGSAIVSGNAGIYADAKVSKPCIVISGLLWNITITDNHIGIGCEQHTIENWAKFKDSRIKLMDDRALEFWKEYKSIILTLANRKN